MRKLLHLMAMLGCVLTMSISTATAGPSDRAGECNQYARSVAVIRIMKFESYGGDPLADNPRSSAFGCGQLLRATRIRYAKGCSVSPSTMNAEEQMCMLHAYIDERYDGSDAKALRFRISNGYY